MRYSANDYFPFDKQVLACYWILGETENLIILNNAETSTMGY